MSSVTRPVSSTKTYRGVSSEEYVITDAEEDRPSIEDGGHFLLVNQSALNAFIGDRNLSKT